MVRVIVVRHGEKDGDALTAKGAMQAYAAAFAFGWECKIDRLYYSGLNRAWQSAIIAAAALGINPIPIVNNGLNFEKTMKGVFADPKECLAEAKAIREATTGTVGHALFVSEYARRGREVMLGAITNIAVDLIANGQDVALCFSHSPWLELAADPSTPYCLGECDAIVFTFENGTITSELVRAPLVGKANV